MENIQQSPINVVLTLKENHKEKNSSAQGYVEFAYFDVTLPPPPNPPFRQEGFDRNATIAATASCHRIQQMLVYLSTHEGILFCQPENLPQSIRRFHVPSHF